MVTGRKRKLADKYNDRHRRFMEVMEDIYGPEAQEMPVKVLISRHRDLAEQLLGVKKAKFDPFVSRPKVDVEN